MLNEPVGDLSPQHLTLSLHGRRDGNETAKYDDT